MGTRADFYVRTDAGLEWNGSVAMDGYDVAEMKREHAGADPRNQSCWDLKQATTEVAFRASLQRYFSLRDDVTLPGQGWPWPWEDSTTTDMAYVFDGSGVKIYSWGAEVLPGTESAEGHPPAGGWPNMSDMQNVTLGPRSGIIVVGGGNT